MRAGWMTASFHRIVVLWTPTTGNWWGSSNRTLSIDKSTSRRTSRSIALHWWVNQWWCIKKHSSVVAQWQWWYNSNDYRDAPWSLFIPYFKSPKPQSTTLCGWWHSRPRWIAGPALFVGGHNRWAFYWQCIGSPSRSLTQGGYDLVDPNLQSRRGR